MNAYVQIYDDKKDASKDTCILHEFLFFEVFLVNSEVTVVVFFHTLSEEKSTLSSSHFQVEETFCLLVTESLLKARCEK